MIYINLQRRIGVTLRRD